ncbi:unnamed protein product [Euphydryas editha]|uniref:Uncharacterized protein n=1 Tax=Euphydryas editha TaxID=104508 RepID=A0AAU9UZW6_EUPED|nr:unnamed protein product [Euphydryas editha]
MVVWWCGCGEEERWCCGAVVRLWQGGAVVGWCGVAVLYEELASLGDARAGGGGQRGGVGSRCAVRAAFLLRTKEQAQHRLSTTITSL